MPDRAGSGRAAGESRGDMARIVLFGPDGTKSFQLSDKVVTIGRSPANNIPIDDTAASRKHCMIKKEPEDTYTLVDMGSANGTSVNGEKIAGEHHLETEDRIKIGKTILVFKEH
jgi:pSer/pThr/pTyr-binding forkhead associated (FHA) protein